MNGTCNTCLSTPPAIPLLPFASFSHGIDAEEIARVVVWLFKKK
jgi:hypothetical protein